MADGAYTIEDQYFILTFALIHVAIGLDEQIFVGLAPLQRRDIVTEGILYSLYCLVATWL